MVQQADGGRAAALVTSGIDLTDRELAPDDDERAMEGDPEAKLAEIGRLASEQRALRRVATLVAQEVSPERVFMAVSEECARVLSVTASTVLRYEDDGTATIVARHNRDSIDVFRIGETLAADEHSAVGAVLRTGAPARNDDWGGAEPEFRTGYRSNAAAPIVVAARCGARSRSPARTRSRRNPRTGSGSSASWCRWRWRARRRART